MSADFKFNLIILGVIAWQLWAAFKGHRMRRAEEKDNTRFEKPTSHQLAWHATHTRDDVATIVLMLGLTNVLLAVIVAALLTK